MHVYYKVNKAAFLLILVLLTVIGHESRKIIWNNKIFRIFAAIIYEF